MDERRSHPRFNAELQIEVFDRHSGRLLGRIADLSDEGFMLFAEGTLESDSVWECRLQPTTPGLPTVECGADCLWSRQGADGRHAWAGFHIIDISTRQATYLLQLISAQKQAGAAEA